MHQLKFKEFNALRYKPKPTLKTTNFTEGNKLLEKSPQNTERPTYAEIIKATKNPSIRTSKTNLNNYKTYTNIHEIFYSLSPTIGTGKQGNIPLRNNSSHNVAKNDKWQQEINNFKEEIKLLKQSKKQQYNPKTEMYRNNINPDQKTRSWPLCFTGGATKKCKTNDHHQLHRTSHENFVKLWRTIENTTGLQSDPAG